VSSRQRRGPAGSRSTNGWRFVHSWEIRPRTPATEDRTRAGSRAEGTEQRSPARPAPRGSSSWLVCAWSGEGTSGNEPAGTRTQDHLLKREMFLSAWYLLQFVPGQSAQLGREMLLLQKGEMLFPAIRRCCRIVSGARPSASSFVATERGGAATRHPRERPAPLAARRRLNEWEQVRDQLGENLYSAHCRACYGAD
jgi:hypothetical protein